MTRLPAPIFPRIRVEQGLGIPQKRTLKPLSEAETGTKIGRMLKASDKALVNQSSRITSGTKVFTP